MSGKTTSSAEAFKPNPTIPLLDFSEFQSDVPAVADEASRALFAAMRDIGFIYLRNHSIPLETIDQAFSYSKQFFSLPEETKMLAPHPPGSAHHRGYSGVGKEKVSQHVFDKDNISKLRSVPDIKESYEIGRDTTDSSKQPNIWLPESHQIPGFEEFFLDFYEQVYQLQLQILAGLAKGLGIDPSFLLDYHRNGDCQTRLLHYPSVKESILRSGQGERIAAHSDFGTITLLWQDEVGGLEVESPPGSGIFVAAPYIPGTVLVNLGDFLQRWSNDVLRSTVHRVVAPPLQEGEVEDGERVSRERFSIVQFMSCDYEKVVDCLPGCWSEERPKRYAPTNALEYVQMRMAALYS